MKAFRILITALLLTSASTILAASVNVNTANPQALQELDGIGPVLAQAIVEYREANGGFASKAELTEVSGIGDATLESIRDAIILE